MGWIFGNCLDSYGLCIRQYGFVALSFVTCIISIYSVIMTYRKLHKFKFELIPLGVNCVGSLYLMVASLQQQQESTYLILFVFELYTYSLMSYTYIILYLRGTDRISKHTIKYIRVGFIVFSFLIGISIVTLIVLEIADQIPCNNKLGTGNFILSGCELPLCAITIVFIFKTKAKIKALEQKKYQTEHEHLLASQDSYIKVRYQQANFTLFLFMFSFLTHILTLTLFLIQPISCNEGRYTSDSLLQLLTLSFFDIGTILPHIIMPFILYFIPARFHFAGTTVVIIPNKRGYSSFEGMKESKLEQEERIRENLLKHNNN